MAGMLPVAVYGLKVPAGDVMVPALKDFPATFHVTMAAIDPSATPEHTGTANGDTPARSTVKIIYAPGSPDDDNESDLDSEEAAMQMRQLLGADSEDDDEDMESSSDDEAKNGGPSDPSKNKKARKEAAAAQLLKALAQEGSDEELDDSSSSPAINGFPSKKSKGKAKADPLEDQASSNEDSDDDAGELEELVLCTLDPNQHYQQALNLTVPEGQTTFFKVSGTHAVYLTGNYVLSPDDSRDDSEENSDYDMTPDEDELEGELDHDESDELDDLEDPRITELESEDDEVPKPAKNGKKEKAIEKLAKGTNKRSAEESDEEAATLDAIMDKSLKPAEPAAPAEPKLTKKQLKKLKNNAGKAVEVGKDVKEDPSPAKGDKKVQFAKNLEQGPTGAAKEVKAESKAQSKEDAKAGKKENTKEKPKAALGVKILQDGVKTDDKKLGTGPACKKGDKVSMRYIGKLDSGKVFDANKKGPPFTFTIGGGEVIKGWDSGIPGMSVGGERRVTVPAKLAYGNKGTSGIPPNSQLTFDVKLLNIG
ncbi:MAG: hypothetical protein Q9195_000003 [Heterodermia aff. obscurata]